MRRMLTTVLIAATVTACGDDELLGPETRTFQQFDRIGRPAINTVFIPSSEKNGFNVAAPANDVAAYSSAVVDFLVTVAGQSQADAEGLASALLPDILTIDVSQPSGFLNGRTLADDVITAELGLIFGSNAALNDDHVDANDVAFLATFPYLASPFVQ